jgi:tetratricopeptide (TPR) repeat protein
MTMPRSPASLPGSLPGLPRQRRHLPLSRIRFPMAIPAILLVLIGCGTGQLGVPAPSPAEIPALEVARSERPADPAILIRLGAAYLEAGRGEEALPVLQRAQEVRPGDPAGQILLGLAHESQENWSEARSLYASVLAGGQAGPFRTQVERRLVLLRRLELEAAVREAVSVEAQLAETPPRPGTVAVFPLQFGSGDPMYRPLSRALAELMVTGLSQVDRVTVLERMRVQFLLDELALGEENLLDPVTAARSGRLLGAGRIVQGRLDIANEEIDLLAAVVRVGGGPTATSPLEDRDALAALFDLQERVVLAVFADLGIELTPVEQDRVTRRPTSSLQALLAFGRGLEAEDRGDFEAALDHYRSAGQLDPGFQEAQQGAERSQVFATGHVTVPEGSGATREVPGIPGPVRDAGAEWGITAGSGGGVPSGVVTPTERDPVAELLGNESPGSVTAIVEILLRMPGR